MSAAANDAETMDVDARGETNAFGDGDGDAASRGGKDAMARDDSGAYEAPRETPGATLPMRVLDEYEFRDKFEDGKATHVHAVKPRGVVVLGKARKLEGGERGAPSDVLAEPLVPLDKPPHALKLVDVCDWCFKYGEDEPEIWLVTSRAWYKLLSPASRFERYVTVTARRAKFTNEIVKALRKAWDLSLDDGLAAILAVPVVAHDVPMAVKTPTKAARLLGNTTAEEQKDAALDGLKEEDAKDASLYKYTHADIVGDGFFIVNQLETLVKSRALRAPGASETDEPRAPMFLTELQNWTTEKHNLGNMTKATRLERDRARRERVRLEKMAEVKALKKPREPRLEPPPPAMLAFEHYSHVGPALQTEVLTLWDYVQVFGDVLHCPPCPLERFAKTFLGSELGAAEVAVWRDVMVAFMRLIEARTDALDCESSKSRPKHSRWWGDAVFSLNDLNEIDWPDRASALIHDLKDGPGMNERVRRFAIEAAAKIEQGASVVDLSPTHRVSLASALSTIAMESEVIHEYVNTVTERARANRKTGEFHITPPLVADAVPTSEVNTKKEEDDVSVKEEDGDTADDEKKDMDGVDVMDTDAADEDDDNESVEKPPTLTEYRRSQLMKWRSQAIDRAVMSRGKPVAVDEQGRRYFALGGLNNAGRVFVEVAPEGWHPEDDSPPQIIDDEEIPKQPMAGPPVHAWKFKEDLEEIKGKSPNVSGLVEYASLWGMYVPGPSLDALSEWCNPSYDNERYITRVHKLITHSVDGMEDENAQVEGEVLQERVQTLCSTLVEDGYAALDDVPLASMTDGALVSRLINVVRFILHSLPFWRSPNGWLGRFIDTSARIDVLSSASDTVLVDILKLLPAIEGLCRDCYILDEASWADARPTWLAQLRFYIYGPRTEAELEAAAHFGHDAGDGDEYPGVKDVKNALELVDALPDLNVRRAANLINQFIRFQIIDTKRMSSAAFKQCTGVSSGVPSIKAGAIVALIKKGLTKTYNRYVERKNRPRNWIDQDTLRPVERCIVLSTAYRASEPSHSRSDDAETPPCTWLMCMLVDSGETQRSVGTRKQVAEDGDAEDGDDKDARRLVMAPVYAGGDIADYVLDWNKYEDSRNKPWVVHDRIMMQFEGVSGGDESNGIVAIDDAVYYLGRVRRVRTSPDCWETVQVVFDSDPEDWMWVSPWEIVAAPEKYHDPVFDRPGAIDPDRELTEEDMAAIVLSKSIARRLGWPAGTRHSEFDKLRAQAYRGHPPSGPVFCHAPLNLYRVFIETMHLGGYESVTRNKYWKQVARTLGRDLSTQTSASFALRTAYEKCLHELEKYLSTPEMIEKLDVNASTPETMDAFPGTVPGTARKPVDEDEDDVDNDEEEEEEEEDDDDDDDDKAKKRKRNADDDDDDVVVSDDDFDADEASDEGDDSDSDFVR